MNKQTITFLVIGIFIGGFLGMGGAYSLYLPKITDLDKYLNESREEYIKIKNENQILLEENEELNTEIQINRINYDELSVEYNNRVLEYDSLNENYVELLDSYNELEYQYGDIRKNVKLVESYYDGLSFAYKMASDSILQLKEYINSYVLLQKSFPRVLNNQTVNEVYDEMLNVVEGISNKWDAIYELYAYVSDIQYNSDPPIPTFWIYPTIFNGTEYVGNCILSESHDLMITPQYFLNNGGDCEDYAITLYALIHGYLDYIGDDSIIPYVVTVAYHDGGPGHAFVLIQEGETKIRRLDPANQYYLASTQPREASIEIHETLSGYKNIVLYNININDGSFECVFFGTPTELNAFFYGS